MFSFFLFPRTIAGSIFKGEKCTFSNARIFVYKSLCRWSWVIFNMVMYVVHFHPVQQKYKTHICSRATLFQFFVIFLTFIPPLIIAYVTNGKPFLIASVSQTWSFSVDLCVLFINFAHLPRKITGFWLKESTYREQPDVRFKHEMLLVVQGNTPDSFLGYSTFQNFNQLLQQKLRIPLIKVRSNEFNAF